MRFLVLLLLMSNCFAYVTKDTSRDNEEAFYRGCTTAGKYLEDKGVLKKLTVKQANKLDFIRFCESSK